MGANEESALVQRCQAGEHGAREDLVIVYQRVVYTLAFRMTGDREEARAWNLDNVKSVERIQRR